MKIAILTPSRERIQKKIDLVDSIKKTVDNIDNVVLYFGIDEDDPQKSLAYELASKNAFIKIVDIKNDGKFLGLGKLWNICANEAKEEILAMIGDDMVFMTKGWDTKIIEEFSGDKCPKDNIKMVYCYDGRHGRSIAVNFFVHRAYMELVGYLTREEFMVDFIDLWVQQVFYALGRATYRGDIHIEHRHWSFRKSQKDNVADNLRGNQYPSLSQKLWVDMTPERVKEVSKIALVISVVPSLAFVNSNIPG